MIRLYLGMPGSGKTASAVMDMLKNKEIKFYSNILTKKIKNNTTIDPAMIYEKELIETKKNGKQIYKYTVNVDFWKSIPKPINVIIDEVHSILNSRRAMSKQTNAILEWLSLIRRVLGSADGSMGTLTLISQLDYRIDSVARDMATNIRYHLCHFTKTCLGCGLSWREHNEFAEPIIKCPKCGQRQLLKRFHRIEVFCFKDIERFQEWRDYRRITYYRRFIRKDIEQVFSLYDTFQWEHLFSSNAD